MRKSRRVRCLGDITARALVVVCLSTLRAGKPTWIADILRNAFTELAIRSKPVAQYTEIDE